MKQISLSSMKVVFPPLRQSPQVGKTAQRTGFFPTPYYASRLGRANPPAALAPLLPTPYFQVR
jgi:hypothetical protein